MRGLRQGAALLEVARAHSAAGAGLAVWVGGRLAGAAWQGWWLAPMLVAFLLSAAGNALNDAQDAAVDRLNRPKRPIPRGALSPQAARQLAAGCAGMALLLALPFGWLSTVGTLAGIGLLVGYTTHLKQVPVVGNGVVGLLTGMAMGYGGLLAGDVPAVLLPAAALGLLFGGRELLKTIHDLPGDQAHALRTVATVGGPRVALRGATLCFGGALLLLGVWALGQPGRWPVLALTGVASVFTLAPLWHNLASRTAMRWALGLSKGIGLVALLGFSVG